VTVVQFDTLRIEREERKGGRKGEFYMRGWKGG